MIAVSNIIEVRNLTKRYKQGETNAVDGVSFSVKEGEFFSLLGPNGAGKTTTISILTTTLSSTSGEILINGMDIEKNASQVRRQIGIIFQKPSLDENLTAEENVRFHTILYGLYPARPSYAMMPKVYKDKVQELAEVVGISKELFKPIKTFSGGMKRKLEIVRGLMHQPKVLFLDEPTTGLDPASRHNLWQYLQSIRKSQNITIFLTTHYLEEAEGADRVCIIHNGRIVSLGTPQDIKKDLIQNYLFVDAQDRNALRNELEKHGLHAEEVNGFKIFLNGKNIQQIIQTIKTPLTEIKTHTPTLEEAYLSIIEDNGKDQNEPNS